MNMAGQVWLVTGASEGIGREIAGALVACGARVALSARREAPLRAAADELARHGAQVLAVPIDVRSEASIAAGIEKAPDCLIVVSIVEPMAWVRISIATARVEPSVTA